MDLHAVNFRLEATGNLAGGLYKSSPELFPMGLGLGAQSGWARWFRTDVVRLEVLERFERTALPAARIRNVSRLGSHKIGFRK